MTSDGGISRTPHSGNESAEAWAGVQLAQHIGEGRVAVIRALDGKVAVVTGAASGIGKAAAIAFAREGAQVVVADIDVVGGQLAATAITEAGGEAVFVRVDVLTEVDVERMVDAAITKYGRLDCALNNAGVLGELVPMIDCTEENWDRVLGVNLKGVWLSMKHEIPAMLEHGSGAIVNTASIFSVVGSGANGSPYVASKHGVLGLTKAAALEYAMRGIRVNAVCPAYIRTPLLDPILGRDPKVESMINARHPVGRMGTPEEVAEAVVWLCSDAARFVTGHGLCVDGGFVAQ
jgi:NAD(P)-dependent dehydrogenase (short-subunit alcohol dehydrogenase family)